MTEELLTEEWVIFRALVNADYIKYKIQQAHITMAMNILYEVLIKLLNEPSIIKLSHSIANAAYFSHITSIFQNIISAKMWQRTTSACIVRVIHKILETTTVPKPIIRCFKLPCSKKTWNSVLGKKCGRLPQNHPVRSKLEDWCITLKKYSKNQSDGSLKNVIHFYLSELLPKMSIDIFNWPDNLEEIVLKHLSNKDFVESICCADYKKYHWIQLFSKKIAKFNNFDVVEIEKIFKKKTCVDFDGDAHKISSDDLEKIQNVAKQDLEDELFFMTLITTGMRIGGFINMKTLDVAELQNGKWIAKQQGKTMEKGPKIFNFLIHAKVQELLSDWLNKKRGFDPSEYVFPGKFEGPRTTAYFRKRFNVMCLKANLEGKQFHPHALRHSYASMLLKSGNSAEIVAKLINHNNSATTQKYYLKESVREVTERANIPWITKTLPNKKRPNDFVPNFLIQKKK